MTLHESLTRNPFTLWWLAWFALWFSTFAVLEYLALRHGPPGSSLSANVRALFDHQHGWVVALGWIFGLWLTWHFLYKVGE